jgi:large subunit ribosomal protein L10
MAKTKNEKRETVQDLIKKLQEAKSVVFANYQGLTVAQLTELRQKLKKSEAELSVVKNTLLKRATTLMVDFNSPSCLEVFCQFRAISNW